MSGDGIERRWRLAQEIAREAGKLAQAYFDNRAALNIEEKGRQDFVSRADKETEALIVSRLGLECPQDGILGEEGGRYGSLGHGDGGHGTWVIDPIDGTANFLHGIPLWAISIGFIHEGRLEIGLVYCPPLDEMFEARRGHGARLNSVPIHCTKGRRLNQSAIGLGYGFSKPLEGHLGAIETLIRNGADYRRLGSAALGLAYVAAGRLQGFYEARLNAWDVLGGLVLVEAAGGRVNDFLGNDGLHRGNRVLAAEADLYDDLEKLLGP